MLLKAFQALPFEAGCDEAGRGCLAGPVFAASVIFPEQFHHPEIQDSKILSESRRVYLREIIKKEALAYSISFVDPEIIDQINIHQASIRAMHQSLDNLNIKPSHIIIDGNYFLPYKGIPHSCIIKGDSHFLSIAAASILAKTHRDDFMREVHNQYPEYGWNKNKGYPTREHRRAIEKWGLCPLHRKTFRIR